MAGLTQKIGKLAQIGIARARPARKLGKYQGLPLAFVGGTLVYRLNPLVKRAIARIRTARRANA